MKNSSIKNALEEMAAKALAVDINDPDENILKVIPDEFDEVIECSDENVQIGTNLRLIPVSHWESIDISPLSKFGSGQWDFTCYPCVDEKGARVNFFGKNKKGVDYSNEENKHRLNLFKAIAFYQVPHFSYSFRVSSYGSLSSRRGRLVRMFNMLCDFDIYRNNGENIPAGTLDEVGVQKVKEYISGQESPSMRWELAFAIGIWQNLSRARLLPSCYSISSEFFSKEEISSYRLAYDEGRIGYLPLKLDDYALVFNHCKSVLVNFAEDALWLARNFCTSSRMNKEGCYEKVSGLSCGSNEGVMKIEGYSPALLNGIPWWDIVIRNRDRSDGGKFVNPGEIAKSISIVFSAAVTLIFATTGMRRSEVRMLKESCIERNSEGFWINYSVYKTSHASQGVKRRIPIPEITAKAIDFLRSLSKSSRNYGGHDYLFSTLLRDEHFGKLLNTVFIERSLNRVAEACGLESGLHSHQFRKSLAMYVIYQDSRNIDLIAHLFSHKSLRMTLRYLLSLPSVSDEIRKQLLIHNVDILEEVISAAVSGSIGGVAGNRVKDALEKLPAYTSKLHDGTRENLVEYIDSLLDQGIVMLHRTSMAICMKTPMTHEFSPCNGKNESAMDRLSPNIWACSPNGCSFAVFTERHIERLENDIAFHRNILNHQFSSEKQINFSKIKIVEYRKRLREVKGDRVLND